jgi:hypothetical protein
MSGAQGAPGAGPGGDAYSRRHIDVAFSLGTGDFGDGKPNTLTLSGLRVQAAIVVAGGPSLIQAEIRVFGMTLDHMNKLSRLGLLFWFEGRNNAVALSAGSDGTAMSLAFQGYVQNAWAAPAQPEVPFVVTAADGGLSAFKPIPVSSYQGAVDVATICAALARQMGLRFENNGVSQIVSNPYLAGTATSQLDKLRETTGVHIEQEKGVLAIWPKNGARGGQIPLINAATMIGYPTFNSAGITVTTRYNPAITFGAAVQVESELTMACGKWSVYAVAHELESETPGGSWQTTISCNVFGHEQSVK